ncbi:hypothetical protein FGB62_205g03 [Gracilaria domingensis]|nr:hypothetical protein FGB62_205g03 [Gracilaria domingensis]
MPIGSAPPAMDVPRTFLPCRPYFCLNADCSERDAIFASEDKPLVVGKRLTAPSPANENTNSPENIVIPISGLCAALALPVRRFTSFPAPAMVPATDGASDFPSVESSTDTPHGEKVSNALATPSPWHSGILSIAMSGRGSRGSLGWRGSRGISKPNTRSRSWARGQGSLTAPVRDASVSASASSQAIAQVLLPGIGVAYDPYITTPTPADRANFGPSGLTPDVFRTELEKVTSWPLNVSDAVWDYENQKVCPHGSRALPGDPHVPDDAEYGAVVQTPDAATPSIGPIPASSGQGAPASASLPLSVPSAGLSRQFAAPNVPVGGGKLLTSPSVAGLLILIQHSCVSTLNRPGPHSIQEALALPKVLIPRHARYVAAFNSISAFRSQFQADLYRVVTDQVGALAGRFDAASTTGDPLLGTLVGPLIPNSDAYPVGNVLQPPLGPTGTEGGGSAPPPGPDAPPTLPLSTPMAISSSMVRTLAVGAGAGPVPAWAPGAPPTPSGSPSGPGPSGGAGGSAAPIGP